MHSSTHSAGDQTSRLVLVYDREDGRPSLSSPEYPCLVSVIKSYRDSPLTLNTVLPPVYRGGNRERGVVAARPFLDWRGGTLSCPSCINLKWMTERKLLCFSDHKYFQEEGGAERPGLTEFLEEVAVLQAIKYFRGDDEPRWLNSPHFALWSVVAGAWVLCWWLGQFP